MILIDLNVEKSVDYLVIEGLKISVFIKAVEIAKFEVIFKHHQLKL